MNVKPKLAIFDVDGTIADRGNIPPEIVSGIKHLHSLGCITTVSTGRGFIRLKETLGEDFDTIISPEALLILEHGTKIVDRSGETVFGEFFSKSEIEHIIDFARANIELFKLVWYNPLDVSRKVEVCCLDEKDIDAEIKKRSHYARVFVSSLGELKELMLKEKLTNVTLKLKDYVKVENLKLAFTRTDTNVIFQDGNMEFIKNNINKGLSVRNVARQLHIEPEQMLIAGNAINDVEMLDAGSGLTILVGDKTTRDVILSYLSNPSQVVAVQTPAALGEFLAKL